MFTLILKNQLRHVFWWVRCIFTLVKVVHVSFSGTSGGAARAAERLHTALRNDRVDSFLLSRDPPRSPGDVRARGPLGLAGQWMHQKIERLVVEAQRHSDDHMRSVCLFDGPAIRAIERLDPDVVNLHLTSFGFMSIRQLPRITKPVVWTLHDMWAFSGAEHYSDDQNSARWREGYRRNNRLPNDHGFDLDKWTWNRKMKHWGKPIQLVTPSNWLAECCRSAALTTTWPVEVIPYSIEKERFPVIDQLVARRHLGLDPHSAVIVFGAAGAFNDPRKGWDLLKKAIPEVQGVIPQLQVIVFGGSPPSSSDLLEGTRWLGVVKRDIDLANIYAAGDVLALPSRHDNLPLVGMEAQTCGLPVVGFRVCGIPDFVPSPIMGALAQPFDVKDFASKLISEIQISRSASERRRAIRDSALRQWSPEVVSAAYQRLYRKMATN